MIKRVVALALLGLALAACGEAAETAGTPVVVTTGDGMGTPAPEHTDPTREPPLQKKLGERFTWEDGATTSTSLLKKYNPTSTSAGHTPGNAAFEVTVTIGTSAAAPLDLTLADVKARAGTQGAQCEKVYDRNIGGSFSATVSSGRSETVRFAFSCPPDAPLAVVAIEVAPSWDHSPAVFEGGL